MYTMGSYEFKEQYDQGPEQLGAAGELSQEDQELAEAQEAAEAPELSQQPEAEEAEEVLGYSSDYYKHEMASAIESGNTIAYENAKRHYAEAKAKESVGAGEVPEEGAESTEEKESLGYSSEYYKHQMASAIESGNNIAYKNAKRHYAEEKAKEETK